MPNILFYLYTLYLCCHKMPRMHNIATQHNALFSLHHCNSGSKNRGEYQRSRNRMESIAAHNPAMVSYYNLYTRQYEYLHAEYERLLYAPDLPTGARRGYADFYPLVHPDDIETLYHAEIEAFKMISNHPEACRSNFTLITTPRVRTRYGTYCRLLRRVSNLIQGCGGNLWLLTITAEMLENNARINNEPPKLYNATTGLTYCIAPGKSWSPYTLPLSPSETTMLYLFGQQFTNREVADILFRSVHTVATYRSRILRTFQTDDIRVVYKLAASLGGFHSVRISDLFHHKKKSIN